MRTEIKYDDSKITKCPFGMQFKNGDTLYLDTPACDSCEHFLSKSDNSIFCSHSPVIDLRWRNDNR